MTRLTQELTSELQLFVDSTQVQSERARGTEQRKERTSERQRSQKK